MSATPIETWSNIVVLLYNSLTGYMVMKRCSACQPVNRLLSADDDASRSVPGFRQHTLLAGQDGADRDAERARRSRGLGRKAEPQGAASPRRNSSRRSRCARRSTGCSTPGAGQGAGAARDLEALNQALAAGAGAHDAEARSRRLRLGCRRKAGTALALLAPVLWSAGDLLAGRGSTGCGAAPIPNAAGCSSTTAAPASGAGARCRPAATAPRRGATITRSFGRTLSQLRHPDRSEAEWTDLCMSPQDDRVPSLARSAMGAGAVTALSLERTVTSPEASRTLANEGAARMRQAPPIGACGTSAKCSAASSRRPCRLRS